MNVCLFCVPMNILGFRASNMWIRWILRSKALTSFDLIASIRNWFSVLYHYVSTSVSGTTQLYKQCTHHNDVYLWLNTSEQQTNFGIFILELDEFVYVGQSWFLHFILSTHSNHDINSSKCLSALGYSTTLFFNIISMHHQSIYSFLLIFVELDIMYTETSWER